MTKDEKNPNDVILKLIEDVNYMKGIVDTISQRLESIDKRLDRLEQKLGKSVDIKYVIIIIIIILSFVGAMFGLGWSPPSP